MELRNIVFDLGGVVFARDPRKCSREFIEFFSFVASPQMPLFWEEYDRGSLTFGEVKEQLCAYNGCDDEKCDAYLHTAIDMQEEIPSTKKLIERLKAAGYNLYVLSNMSREFIAFLRRFPVYRNFDGEVVSCEEHTVKPEEQIYRIMLTRYGLDPSQTLFIDDRRANLDAAARLGIGTFHFNHRDPASSCSELEKMLL